MSIRWMVSNKGNPHQAKAHAINDVGKGLCGYNPTKRTMLTVANGQAHCPRCVERLKLRPIEESKARGLDWGPASAPARATPDRADHILEVDRENIRLKEDVVQLRASLYLLYDAAGLAWEKFLQFGPVDDSIEGVEFDDALVNLRATANHVRKTHKIRQEKPPAPGEPPGAGGATQGAG